MNKIKRLLSTVLVLGMLPCSMLPASAATTRTGEFIMNSNTELLVGSNWTDEMKANNFAEVVEGNAKTGSHSLSINAQEMPAGHYINLQMRRNNIPSVPNASGVVSQKIIVYSKNAPEELLNVQITPQHDWSQRTSLGEGFSVSGPDGYGWYKYEKTYWNFEMAVVELLVLGPAEDVIIDDIQLLSMDLDFTGDALTENQLMDGSFEDVTKILGYEFGTHSLKKITTARPNGINAINVQAGGNYKFILPVKNKAIADGFDLEVVVAVYEGNKLYSVTSVPASIAVNASQFTNVEVPFTVPTGGGYTAKVFTLDSKTTWEKYLPTVNY